MNVLNQMVLLGLLLGNDMLRYQVKHGFVHGNIHMLSVFQGQLGSVGGGVLLQTRDTRELFAACTAASQCFTVVKSSNINLIIAWL